MKAKLNFRSVVFKRAYIIVKQTGCSFSSGLTQAWNLYREFKAKKVQELSEKIKGFDFTYAYTDDYRVSRYWIKTKEEISFQLRSLPNSFISSITAQLSNTKNIHSFI